VNAFCEILCATEQLRLSYDATHYFSSTIAATGIPTFTNTGNSFIYSSADATTLPPLTVLNSSTGDAAARFALGTTISYALGIDATNNNFVLSTAASGTAVLGTGNLLSITSAGRLSLGITPDASIRLYIGGVSAVQGDYSFRTDAVNSYAPTGADNSYCYGFDARNDYSGTARTTGGVYVVGAYIYPTWTGTLTVVSPNSYMAGVDTRPSFRSEGGTLPAMYGMRISRSSLSMAGNVITDSYGLYIVDHAIGGSDVVTTDYGIYIENIATGGTNWALYCAGGKIYSAGELHLDGDFNHDGTNFGALGTAPAAQRAHVADPSGGVVQDAEARTAINAILVTLETFGFHATA
jgi:hypothetical protein